MITAVCAPSPRDHGFREGPCHKGTTGDTAALGPSWQNNSMQGTPGHSICLPPVLQTPSPYYQLLPRLLTVAPHLEIMYLPQLPGKPHHTEQPCLIQDSCLRDTEASSLSHPALGGYHSRHRAPSRKHIPRARQTKTGEHKSSGAATQARPWEKSEVAELPKTLEA